MATDDAPFPGRFRGGMSMWPGQPFQPIFPVPAEVLSLDMVEETTDAFVALLSADLKGLKAPTATTNPASGVTSSGATLNGMINPNGNSTHCYFEWGTSTTYGSAIPTQSDSGGTSDVNVSALINGLTPNTTYHYRLVAISSAGRTNGGDQTFETLVAPLYLPLILR